MEREIHMHIGAQRPTMSAYFSHLILRQKHRLGHFSSPAPSPNLGGFDKDRNPNSETLHAMSLSHESQELLQFADAYVLIPFSMKRDPTPCAIKVMFLRGGFLPAGRGRAGGGEGEPRPRPSFRTERLSELLGGLLGPGEPGVGREVIRGRESWWRGHRVQSGESGWVLLHLVRRS